MQQGLQDLSTLIMTVFYSVSRLGNFEVASSLDKQTRHRVNYCLGL